MSRVSPRRRIIAVLSAVSPMTARRIAAVLGINNLRALRKMLYEMAEEGLLAPADPTPRDYYESRGTVKRAWKLSRYAQPEQQHCGVRL